MKKLLLTTILTIMSLSVFAQRGEISGHVQAGYQTEWKRFGLGVEGRYGITEAIRVAPDLMFFFPKNNSLGLDINVNAHYVFPLSSEGLSVYPLAGLNMSNNRQKIKYSKLIPGAKDETIKTTKWGFNLGAGFDYNLSASSYLNTELKYTFNKWDYLQWTIGYGIRF